jgi:hypothetical protein
MRRGEGKLIKRGMAKGDGGYKRECGHKGREQI